MKSIVFCDDIAASLTDYLSQSKYDKIYVLVDTYTREKCLPRIFYIPALEEANLLTIDAGDRHKDIRQVMHVWDVLSQTGASRASLLINLGGGMVTDLGGFAAATFKRGIHTVNIPTSLMASVDAAVGGKTGINFCGLKNEIGAFYMPECVLIDCGFLHTLDKDNMLSGYAEMIKHGLISSVENWKNVMTFDAIAPQLDVKALNGLVEKSVAIKTQIVAEDPHERGIRKALNFGHTVGHAFESLSFEKQHPILHGHSVAAGMISELFISYKQCGFPIDAMNQTIRFIKENYPPFVFDCNDYEKLYECMTHDKKNDSRIIRFTLLADIGKVRINQETDKKLIFEAFDFYRDMIF